MIKKILLGSGLVLLGSELFLRVFVEPPLLLPFAKHDFVLGHKGPPGATVFTWNNKLEYSLDGFRLLPHVPGEKPGVEIAWLGDSMTEAITIGSFEHFATQVAASTGAHGLLLAAGDWGTAQEVLAFRDYGRKAHPKAVVLNFSSLTDFANNGAGLAHRYQSKVDDLRPYARWKNGALDFYYLHPWYHLLREASQLFLIFDNARLAHALGKPTPISPSCKENPNAIPLQVYFSDPSSEWDDAVETTSYLFAELKKEAESIGANPLAIYLPNDFELLNDKWEDSVAGPAEYCFPGRPISRRENERKFLSAARKAGLDAVSLFDPIQKQATNSDLFLEDGHFNRAGHQLLAKLLTKLIAEKKLLH